MACVLVVDDEPVVLELVKRVLESSGFFVLAANNGPEALGLLEMHAVDALLSDVVMPGMGGAELVAEARRRFPGLPVCMMTGYAPTPVTEGIAVVPKPFDPKDLIATVRRAINTGRQTDERRTTISRLYRQVQIAQAQWRTRTAELDRIIVELPSSIPHPDGLRRIEEAGRRRAAAYREFKESLERYIDALKQAVAGHADDSPEEDSK